MKVAQQAYLASSLKALQHAEFCYTSFVNGGSSFELERLWQEFVGNWQRSYEFLRKASVGGKSQQLHNSIVSDRKNNLVVRYLFQARDTKEHVGDISYVKPSRLDLRMASGQSLVSIQGDSSNILIEGAREIFPDGTERVFGLIAGSIENGKFTGSMPQDGSAIFSPPVFKLLTVINRAGEFPPPENGQDGVGQAKEIAIDGLNYLRDMIISLTDLQEE